MGMSRTSSRGCVALFAVAALGGCLGQAGSPLSSGRAGATVALVVGLVSVAIGGPAFRSAGRIGTGSGRGGPIAALVMGLMGMVLGGLHLARSAGGIGTGNGRGGAILSLVVGLAGMVLGGLALARSRRAG